MVIICSKTMHWQSREKKVLSRASGPLWPLILNFHYLFLFEKVEEK